MIFSVWYSIEEKLPEYSGWVLGYKDISMGDDYTDLKYFYYDNNVNRFFNSPSGSWENVIFWTDINELMFKYKPLNPSETIAADTAIKAIENYNLISGLSS